MTPNLSTTEVAAEQTEAREALEQSKSAEGLEKLRLINAAFPFAIQGNPHGLLIAWKEEGWSIADTGGFITILDHHDVCTMLILIGMENARKGSVREMITGKKRQQVIAPFNFAPKQRKPESSKLTLEELGLKKG